MATSWFNYNQGDTCNPLSYSSIGGAPNCPQPKIELCAIFAQVQLINGVSRPIITSQLCNEIHVASSVSNPAESANVRLRPQ